MKKRTAIITVCLAALAVVSCGRKGALELPPASVPAPIERPLAFQLGGEIVLEWVNPSKYLDGRPAEGMETVEIWALEVIPGREAGKLAPDDIAGKAGLVLRIPSTEFGRYKKLPDPASRILTCAWRPDRAAAGTSYDLYLRARDRRRRASDFSIPVRVVMADCPLAPPSVSAEVSQDSIKVSWTRPLGMLSGSSPARLDGYSIYRREGDGPLKLAATVGDEKPFYEDGNFVFGGRYSYFVRAFITVLERKVESSDAATCVVEPVDHFPPPPPVSVTAVAGPEGISLNWQASAGPDVSGYRISRMEAGGKEPIPLEQGLVPGTSFLDGTARPGATYIYAVSARDRNGNEGPKTGTGPVTAKGARP